MAGSRRLVRSGALLGVAHALEMALPFVRNVAIARLMEPREFALALTLSTIVAIAELTTEIGLPQLAVKSDISNARARGTLQALAAVRSTLVGGLIALLAFPLAQLFDAPEATTGFALVGLGVAMQGFSNLAIKQLGRDFNFGAEAIVIMAAQFVWTLTVVTLSFIWRDHNAMIVGLLFYSATFVVVSQLLAPVRYSIAWDAPFAAEAFRFGRPLIPNGVALAITSLGDRVVIGARLGLDALAVYGPLATTAILPRGAVLRYVYNLSLPVMVRAVEAERSLESPMRGWIAVISLMGVAFALGFMSLAQPAIALVFGARYAPNETLASLMGVLLFCRILITYPVPIAVAKNRTWLVTGSSAIGAFSLLPAAASLFFVGGSFTDGLRIFLFVMAAVETVGIALVVAWCRSAFPDATQGLARSALIASVLVYGLIVACHMLGLENWVARAVIAAAGIGAAALLFAPDALKLLVRRSAD